MTGRTVDPLGDAGTLVVTGYSTSFGWPALLRRKLERHGSDATVHEATAGGTPIAKWLDVETGEPLPVWNEKLQPALANDGPTVVLAQQSLQWAFGEREAGIRGADDAARIERGADVLCTYAGCLLVEGADAVFLATHVYKHPMEPEIGNERLALAALLERDLPNVFPGPDVWEPTREHYPAAFADDGVHPSDPGNEIVAQAWFERLLDHAGRTVPPWSRRELEDAIGCG